MMTSTNLGSLTSVKSIAGTIGTIDDVDCFSFTAEVTGRVAVSSQTTHYLQAKWMVVDSSTNLIMEHEGPEFEFSAFAGQQYWLMLSTTDAIGHYITTLSLGSDLLGDYNGNNQVDLADYTTWRDTRGSAVELAADGNQDGVVDDGDLTVWSQAFGNNLAGGIGTFSVPEKSNHLAAAVVLLVVAAGQRRTTYPVHFRRAKFKTVGRQTAMHAPTDYNQRTVVRTD
jgi:hypothetical protein